MTLTVLNGNGVAGAAGNASYLLAQKGYQTLVPASGQPANAPNWNYFHSKVYYDPSRPKDGKVAAAQVARLVGSADVEPLPQNIKKYFQQRAAHGHRRLDLPRAPRADRHPAAPEAPAGERAP